MSNGGDEPITGSDLDTTQTNQNLPKVSVKTLVEFSAKKGSLDRRFTPSPTAEQGIAGHRLIQSRRHKRYISEMPLNREINGLMISGRADGFCPDAQCMEEIKTFYGDVANIPENHQSLHWAQVLCYAYIYAEQEGVSEISVAVIYFNLHEEKEYRFENLWQKTDLKKYVEDLVSAYKTWQIEEEKRIKTRDAWIREVNFPYGQMHSSQRQMAEAVYKAAARQCQLMVQAPTGTGKTLGAIFPAIKALCYSGTDKLFYLTTKGTAKQLALEALQLISKKHSPLRVLEITAIEKACLEPEKQCNGASCPFALGFYDKLARVRSIASRKKFLDKQQLDALAYKYEICPFYLSMEMARWVDVVVADVNYYFDLNALLLGLVKQFQWKPMILIDEAHNMVERARGMFSVDLDRNLLLSAKKEVPKTLKSTLEKINREWLALAEEQDQAVFLPALSEKLNLSLSIFVNRYTEVLQQFPDHPMQRGSAQEFFFSVVHYQQLQPLINDDFVVVVESVKKKNDVVSIKNIIPAEVLQSRLALVSSMCLFSATFTPASYYQSLLGLHDDNTYFVDLPSPYVKEQLQVNIAEISTRYHDRKNAVSQICHVITEQLREEPGNAIVFFSSYEFLKMVESELSQHEEVRSLFLQVQQRSFSETQRSEFLAAFSERENVLALAVLGGVFSEGVDLVGDRLKGVFIATLGIPKVGAFNDYMKGRIDSKLGSGYEYTYLYPGIQKVVQAAGRVIRSREDSGYLWLLDDRFKQQRIRELLPTLWSL